METRKMKLALSAGALALSLALAGCGGGGSAGAPAGPTDAERAEIARQAQITVVEGAISAADGAVQLLGPSSDDDAIAAAQTLIETAEAEIDKLPEADQAGFDAQLASVQGHHDTAEKLAMEASDRQELMKQIAALRMALGLDPSDDDLEGEIAELQAEVTRLTGLVEAQKEEADMAAAKAMTAKLNKLATEIGPVDSTDLVARFRTDTTKPKMAMDGNDPHAISGWNGMSYSDTNTTSKNVTTTVVYDDKDAPTSVAFNKKYTDIIAAGQDNAGTRVIGTTEADRKLVVIPNLPTNANHNGVKVGPVTPTRGTFDGVPGAFTAASTNAAGVEVKVDTNGVPDWGTTNVLHFKPDSATAMVDKPDEFYMSLGWWLIEDKDGAITMDGVSVAAWSTGADYAPTSFTNLLGKATFEGIAVGKYTHKTATDTTGGHFNANAMLVADFDDTNPGMLRGTIDNFMQNGESIGDGWKVELGAAPTDDAMFDPMMGAAMTVTGVTDTNNGAMGTFGQQKTMGTWNAMFVDNTREDDLPGGVTGHFHIGENGHPINMVGAFAASNMEADQPKQ